MTRCVYHLHSTIELPLDDLYDYLEDPALPDEVADVELMRRNNTLVIRAVAPEGTVGRYTPTAQIKGTVTETRVPDPDAPLPPPTEPTWGEPEEAEQPTKVIEVAAFKGGTDVVLQNTALEYPMFLVLANLAREADRGTLTAIVADDEDELHAVLIVDGEDRPASVEVVESETEEEPVHGVDWRENKYIQ